MQLVAATERSLVVNTVISSPLVHSSAGAADAAAKAEAIKQATTRGFMGWTNKHKEHLLANCWGM